ncbi:hypothetical protein [Paracoccus zhejiangensis]|uniref:hypothetical protein n=1 Tax=Paracoccus zhejiangensis TaxID=1077935 RepID=UPI0013000698|nr:hypothetical protein [Paracoccus zhejiangensis]
MADFTVYPPLKPHFQRQNRWKSGIHPDFATPTYHPNARGMHERKMDHREKGIAYLKDWLSARNR